MIGVYQTVNSTNDRIALAAMPPAYTTPYALCYCRCYKSPLLLLLQLQFLLLLLLFLKGCKFRRAGDGDGVDDDDDGEYDENARMELVRLTRLARQHAASTAGADYSHDERPNGRTDQGDANHKRNRTPPSAYYERRSNSAKLGCLQAHNNAANSVLLLPSPPSRQSNIFNQLNEPTTIACIGISSIRIVRHSHQHLSSPLTATTAGANCSR